MKKVKFDVSGRSFTLETGKVAKQADGAVIAQCGDTVVLATVVAEKSEKKGLDFFPLTIDYQEKAYAAGKIPAGFFKREGRPTEKEVLISRLIDRPIRPLLLKSFSYETQGISSVLSYGDENIADILGIIGMSAALTISDIPFNGPVGAVRVGRIRGSFVINPNLKESEESDMDLVVAGTEEAVVMVEGEGQEILEVDLLKALDIAHEEIRRICAVQNELRFIAGKEKRPVAELTIDEELRRTITELSLEKIKTAITIPDKMRRQNALGEILKELVEKLSTGDKDSTAAVTTVFNDIERKLVRDMILNENVRVDGRRPDEMRRISCEIGVLPRTHGSALFARGETQCLAVVTLGTADDQQKIDSLEGDFSKAFMVHYNFPPFSTGEVKPLLRSLPGRREIGHGMLAEKALKAVIPAKTEFPYTIRIVSDILESNGSTSMATVCGGSLALMDAGVPIKAPVAGIAMGLVKEDDRVVILTDILGVEDHLGDMDFKVAGTEKGITAFQLDTKIAGISRQIMESALEQARRCRLYILNKMCETIAKPRNELSPYAPRIYTMQIKPEKVGDVIGVGGKVIRGIIEQTGVKIEIDDSSGLVNIVSPDKEAARKAIDMINSIVAEAEVGKIYLGKVKKILDFGAVVEIFPGTEGLLHISQLSDRRVAKVTDEIKEGDDVLVKVIEIDKFGKIRLSRKEALRDKSSRRPRTYF